MIGTWKAAEQMSITGSTEVLQVAESPTDNDRPSPVAYCLQVRLWTINTIKIMYCLYQSHLQVFCLEMGQTADENYRQ